MTNIDTTSENIDKITALMHTNLFEVFNEPDDERRAAVITRTYTANVEWHDDEGVDRARCAARKGNCVARHVWWDGVDRRRTGSPNARLRVPPWDLAPKGGEAVVSGFDVALIKYGLINRLYSVVSTTPS